MRKVKYIIFDVIEGCRYELANKEQLANCVEFLKEKYGEEIVLNNISDCIFEIRWNVE